MENTLIPFSSNIFVRKRNCSIAAGNNIPLQFILHLPFGTTGFTDRGRDFKASRGEKIVADAPPVDTFNASAYFGTGNLDPARKAA